MSQLFAPKYRTNALLQVVHAGTHTDRSVPRLINKSLCATRGRPLCDQCATKSDSKAFTIGS
jgi:hypothetical protein